MTLPLQGKHALVTGGNRGIGAAVVAGLLEQGARVTVLHRGRENVLHPAPTTQQQIVVADISEEHQVHLAFAHAVQQFGTIAILVNNAGIAESAPFKRTDSALWQKMLAVNLSGTYFCTRQVLPAMLEANYGRIVNIASTAGLIGYAYVSAYCAAKHGVIGLTRALAAETAQSGVTVNAVCPGYTDTDMVESTVTNIMQKTGRSAADAKKFLAERNPQGRLITPEEVARTVVWLCLPGSEAITGQAIAICGGEVMVG